MESFCRKHSEYTERKERKPEAKSVEVPPMQTIEKKEESVPVTKPEEYEIEEGEDVSSESWHSSWAFRPLDRQRHACFMRVRRRESTWRTMTASLTEERLVL